MKPLIAWLRWDGTTHRLTFVIAAVLLMLVKHALDWSLATQVFKREWSFLFYYVVPVQSFGVATLKLEDRWFFGTLLALAVPFVAVGVSLTLRRLNDVGLPAWLVVLFFVPLVNLLFFLLLAILPGKPHPVVGRDGARDEEPALGLHRLPVGPFSRLPELYRRDHWRALRDAHERITKQSRLTEAVCSLLICVPLAIGFIALSTFGLGNYGWGLFVGTPFFLGLGSVVLFGLSRPQPLGECMLVVMAATSLTGFIVLLLAFEGAICLIMAAPIGCAFTFLGGMVGFAMQARPWQTSSSITYLLVLALTLPSTMAAESRSPAQPDDVEVRTSVDINAPPEVVWQQVIAFPELSEPKDMIFRCGVAYPVRATIDGRGPGAVRRCEFSTGAFVEPIDIWDEPRELAFRVTEQPEPMREWSPFDVHPPHLDHYLVSRQGRFRLTALSDGRTRLEGTTWYANRMWPGCYWQLWSDHIIHTIHLRVLNHIKHLAEADGQALRKDGSESRAIGQMDNPSRKDGPESKAFATNARGRTD